MPTDKPQELGAYNQDGDLYVLIETPKGSRNKYDWEPKLQRFRLTKVLPEGHVFPFDFGFIPGTLGQDGDPLDVLLLTDEAVGFPGCLVEARLLGVIEAEQTERDGKTIRNDRLIAATSVSHLYREVKKLDQLPPCVVDGVEQFFISYNQQAGKEFKPLHRGDPKKAAALVKKGVQQFARKGLGQR